MAKMSAKKLNKKSKKLLEEAIEELDFWITTASSLRKHWKLVKTRLEYLENVI